LSQETVYHVSYSLEEASRLFQLIKNTIDWSTVKLPSVPVVNHAQNGTSEMIHRDEVYARQLQAEFNLEIANRPPQRTQIPTGNRALPVEQTTRGATALQRNQHNGHMKDCGHRCDLVTTRRCCTCSGKIANMKDFLLHSLISFYLN
jgi:hypothetical protein